MPPISEETIPTIQQNPIERVEDYIHVILKNKYNEVYPNNPNGFVTIDMWIHNQTTNKYYEILANQNKMTDVNLWRSLLFYYARIIYERL